MLNTGRVRDQWHTMTRTGLSPRLAVHIGEPFVELHVEDAVRLGLSQGRLARVTTRYGEALLRVMPSERVQPGSLFVPIHWSDQNSSAGRIGALVQPTTDPRSGQPEMKATPASIEPFPATRFGFLLSRELPPTRNLAYWARARMPAGYRHLFRAHRHARELERLVHRPLPEGELLTYEDAGSDQFRVAVLDDGRLQAVLYAASRPELPSIAWLKTRFDLARVPRNERRALIAGRPIGAADEGDVVCACFQVGRNRAF